MVPPKFSDAGDCHCVCHQEHTVGSALHDTLGHGAHIVVNTGVEKDNITILHLDECTKNLLFQALKEAAVKCPIPGLETEKKIKKKKQPKENIVPVTPIVVPTAPEVEKEQASGKLILYDVGEDKKQWRIKTRKGWIELSKEQIIDILGQANMIMEQAKVVHDALKQCPLTFVTLDDSQHDTAYVIPVNEKSNHEKVSQLRFIEKQEVDTSSITKQETQQEFNDAIVVTDTVEAKETVVEKKPAIAVKETDNDIELKGSEIKKQDDKKSDDFDFEAELNSNDKKIDAGAVLPPIPVAVVAPIVQHTEPAKVVETKEIAKKEPTASEKTEQPQTIKTFEDHREPGASARRLKEASGKLIIRDVHGFKMCLGGLKNVKVVILSTQPGKDKTEDAFFNTSYKQAGKLNVKTADDALIAINDSKNSVLRCVAMIKSGKPAASNKIFFGSRGANICSKHLSLFVRALSNKKDKEQLTKFIAGVEKKNSADVIASLEEMSKSADCAFLYPLLLEKCQYEGAPIDSFRLKLEKFANWSMHKTQDSSFNYTLKNWQVDLDSVSDTDANCLKAIVKTAQDAEPTDYPVGNCWFFN